MWLMIYDSNDSNETCCCWTRDVRPGRVGHRPSNDNAVAGADTLEEDLNGSDEDRVGRQLQQLVELTEDCAIVVLDVAGYVLSWNQGAERLHGYPREQALGRHCRHLHESAARDRCEPERLLQIARDVGRAETTGWLVGRDGSSFLAHTVVTALRDDTGELTGYGQLTRRAANADTVQATAGASAALRDAGRLSTVAELALGVVHDINNIVAVILSHTALLEMELPLEGSQRSSLEGIHAAAERATTLSRQLLELGRRRTPERKPVHLAEVVGGVERLIRHLVGGMVRVEVSSGRAPAILADAAQLEQVLLNLVLNARDAMPRGGLLSIETTGVDVTTSTNARSGALTPGRYAVLVVTDTGTGMDAPTRSRIFEPYFTTKSKDRGTGLGLCNVLGIVKEYGGDIRVWSEPGKGSMFWIYLPAAGADEQA
jgi:PAS domain S-box-containing protein